MRSKTGIQIETVAPAGSADRAGLRPGDVLLSCNDLPLNDSIDFMFHVSGQSAMIEYLRDGRICRAHLEPNECGGAGITFPPFKVKTCRNNCVFCFVKQLPRGLRRSLYIKDEDYRLSFLYGNYMTLSNITDTERRRIIDLRLSPIYVSVHTTNKTLRNRMLGNPKGMDIIKELKFFADHKIRMHTQIVLCPGLNDGKDLLQTLADLHKLYPYVASVAVVPVGLTSHRRLELAPVNKDDAVKAISTVESFQKRFRKKHGEQIAFCSDEMFIKAERPFPPLKEYGNLPQIENGVGMVPLFLSQARKVKTPVQLDRKNRYLTFTGTSFFTFLKKFTDRLVEKEGVQLTALPVENRLFGTTVTVAGLLTGRDVIKTVRDHAESSHVLLVPDVALKEDEDIFLDDVTLRDVEEAVGIKTVRIQSTPQGLLDAMKEA